MMKSTLFPCRFCSLGNTTCPSGWHLWRCNSPWYGPSKELLIKVYVRKKQEKKKKQHLTQNTWLLVSSFNRSSDWEDTQGSVLGGRVEGSGGLFLHPSGYQTLPQIWNGLCSSITKFFLHWQSTGQLLLTSQVWVWQKERFIYILGQLPTHLMQQRLPGHLNSSNLSTNVGFQHSNFPDV